MNQEQAKQLLNKYRLGECTDEEVKTVESWYQSLSENEKWEWSEDDKNNFRENLKSNIFREINDEKELPVHQGGRFPFLKLLVAAAIITFIFSAVLYYNSFKTPVNFITASQNITQRYRNDIEPGTTGAVLTLANGKKIILDSSSNKVLAVQGSVNVVSKNGQLVYTGNNTNDGGLLYNTVVTPNAREYQLVLSDGTKVWLNAASSIRYPAVLDPDIRKVEITGEVYFEVAQVYATGTSNHNKFNKIPFVVTIENNLQNAGQVEVLGTHFNINAYDEESLVKTTLFEGSIRIKKDEKEFLLSPGNQSQSNNKGYISIVKTVDTEAAIAWKNGLFSFDKTDTRTVMNQLARWYDLNIEYQDGYIPNENFFGDIKRNVKLSTILKALERSGVKFSIEGNKLTVLK